MCGSHAKALLGLSPEKAGKINLYKPVSSLLIFSFSDSHICEANRIGGRKRLKESFRKNSGQTVGNEIQ